MTVGITESSDGVALRQLAERMRGLRDQTVAEVGRVVVGMEDITHQFLIALLAGGHVLLEGVPGIAKTTLSKTFARVLGIQYQRLQFTPDLLPSDVTGTYIFDRKQNDFVLRRGPIFCQVLLADEVNRAPAKTQSALLEAMQENQVTIEGTTLFLPQPFMVVATQNPVEYLGTYPLPESQMDRFFLRLSLGYPNQEEEKMLLQQGIITRQDDPSHKQKSIYSLTEQGIELLPILAQMAGWGFKYLPVSEELGIRAQLLSEGGPKMWAEFIDELRETHLGAKRRKKSGPSVGERLQAAYEAVVAERRK